MNDRSEETLEEEQEEILLNFLQVMESSQETILAQEDCKKIANYENTFLGRIIGTGEEQEVLTESEETSRDVVKNCRGNATKNQWKTRYSKNELGDEENDSGFATSSEPFLKVATPDYNREDMKITQQEEDEEMDFDIFHSDSEDSCKSIESVSLLQKSKLTDQVENNVNGQSWVGTVLKRKLFTSAPYNEDNMQVREERLHSVDKSVQTVTFISQSEEFIKESSDILSSVINLKYMVLPVSAKKYLDPLKTADQIKDLLVTSPEESDNKSDEMDSEEWNCQFNECEDFQEQIEKNKEDSVSHEDEHFSIKKTNAEVIMQQSVESILVWLKNEMKKNLQHFCTYWHNSIKADAVDMINDVVDLCPGLVRTRVSQFLIEIFDEMYDTDSPVEDIVLEYKMAFLSCFSKSILLSYDLIEHVSAKLSQLAKPRPRSKFQMISSTKKIYFSLRLMRDLLRSFLANLQAEGLESLFCKKFREEELHMRNMGDRDYSRNDSSQETNKTRINIKYINVMAQWCHRTDQVLSICLEEIPLLLKPARMCCLLAQDIMFFQYGPLKRS